jgi:hypothetical protein
MKIFYSGVSGGFGNTTSLGTQNRTGPAILVGSSRSNAGSLARVYSSLKTPTKKILFYNNQATYLYGPGGSAPNRGLSGSLYR